MIEEKVLEILEGLCPGEDLSSREELVDSRVLDNRRPRRRNRRHISHSHSDRGHCRRQLQLRKLDRSASIAPGGRPDRLVGSMQDDVAFLVFVLRPFSACGRGALQRHA